MIEMPTFELYRIADVDGYGPYVTLLGAEFHGDMADMIARHHYGDGHQGPQSRGYHRLDHHERSACESLSDLVAWFEREEYIADPSKYFGPSFTLQRVTVRKVLWSCVAIPESREAALNPAQCVYGIDDVIETETITFSEVKHCLD